MELVTLMLARDRFEMTGEALRSHRATSCPRHDEIWLLCDDDQWEEYAEALGDLCPTVVSRAPVHGSVGQRYNEAAGWIAARDVPWMHLSANDLLYQTIGWCCALTADQTALVAHGDDGYQHERLAVAPVIATRFFRALGWVAEPSLDHLFIDDVWTALSRDLGLLRYRPEVRIIHRMPDDAGTRATYEPERVQHDERAFGVWNRTRRESDRRILAG